MRLLFGKTINYVLVECEKENGGFVPENYKEIKYFFMWICIYTILIDERYVFKK